MNQRDIKLAIPDVQATPETRIGARCTFFEKCFVTQMRRRAADAQLVIVNHHLYFADLALRSQWPEAQVLPRYEVVIFDEAHQIEEIATEFFGLHVSVNAFTQLTARFRQQEKPFRRWPPRAGERPLA